MQEANQMRQRIFNKRREVREMTEEKVKQFFDLINGLSYQEWTVLSREVEKFFKTIQQESVLNLSEKGKDFAVKDTMQLETVFKDIKRESGECFETFPND